MKHIGKDLDCATKNFIELCKASNKQAIKKFAVKELSELVKVQIKLSKYTMLLNVPPYSKEAKSKVLIICKTCKRVFDMEKCKNLHFKLKHITKFKCPYRGCDSKFYSKTNLEIILKSIQKHHRNYLYVRHVTRNFYITQHIMYMCYLIFLLRNLSVQNV